MQYKSGKILVLNASTTVYASSGIDWSFIEVGNWFSRTGDRIGYDIAAVAEGAEPAAYANAAAAIGDRVKGANGLYYIALGTVPVSTPPPNTQYWMEISLWQLTLSAPYTGESVGNVGYTICTDFSPNFSFPLINQGDTQSGLLINRTLTKLDELLVPLGAQAGVNVAYVRDDFIDGGELAWQLEHSGGSIVVVDGEADHPGIVSLTTTDWAQLVLGKDGAFPFKGVSQKDFELTFIFKVASAFAAIDYMSIGLKTPHDSQYVTDFMGLYFVDSTPGSFSASTFRASGGQTIVTLADVNSTWNRIRMRRVPGTARIGFSLNGGSEVIITSNIPEIGITLMPCVLLHANSGQTPEVLLDFFSLAVTNLDR
jgi:hypothetical protein